MGRHSDSTDVTGRAARPVKRRRNLALSAIAAAIVAAGAVVTLLLTLGGTPHHPAAAASRATALTYAKAAAICNELNTWAQTAGNRDQPRFSAQLNQDETEAANTQLGNDLVTFGDDLETSNSLALEPGPPGDEQPVQMVESDCLSYGVTFTP